MRTTLDIDEDIMIYVKEIAGARGVSAGKVLSELARTSLTQREERTVRNGVPLLPYRPGGQMVTLEMVNALRDEEY
jgi:hypothetical protein